MDSTMQSSILFPVLVETGAYIMKLDPVDMSKDINKTIGKVTDSINDTVTEGVKTSTQKIVQETKEKITSSLKGDK